MPDTRTERRDLLNDEIQGQLFAEMSGRVVAISERGTFDLVRERLDLANLRLRRLPPGGLPDISIAAAAAIPFLLVGIARRRFLTLGMSAAGEGRQNAFESLQVSSIANDIRGRGETMSDVPADETAPAPHPTAELSDDDLFRELGQLYETRLDTLRRGSDASLENSDRRIVELEKEYLHRHPQREVSPRRLRPDETSLTPPRRG